MMAGSGIDADANRTRAQGIDSGEWDDVDWYRSLLLQLRYGAGLHNRADLADIIAKTIRERLGFQSPAVEDESLLVSKVNELKQHGFARLGSVLTPDEVAAAREHLQSAPLCDEFDKHDGEFTAKDAPASVNTASMADPVSLATCPHVLELSNRPEILAIVEAFLGAPATTQYYTAWWSFAGRPTPRDAQLFHYDRNCFRFVKLFIYLTDVDAACGPHVYVQGSADVGEWARKLELARNEDPRDAQRFLDMINSVRKQDKDVEDFFGRDRLATLTGSAGDAFLVDTSGIHKGLLPVRNDRLVFQATYALLPLLKDAPPPLRRADLIERCMVRNGSGVDRTYLEYLNRAAVA